MLSQLSISQIAVIEKASLGFEEGMTVLTGETGAGKSIIIDAINAVLGERISKDLIRTGAASARVSALFTDISSELQKSVEELGYPAEEDGSLLLQREIRSSGKSLCKINGMAANVSMLKQLGVMLVGIHGQHESYELLSETAHIEYIDSFGMLEPLLHSYQEAYKRLKSVQHELSQMEMDDGDKSRRIDLLIYQIEEIEEAKLHPGEQNELMQQRDKIRNREQIADALETVRVLLSGNENESGVLSGMTSAAEQLEGMKEYIPELAETVEKIKSSNFLLEDAYSELRSVDVDYDASDLEAIEQRLDLIYRISLKYGQTEEEILQFQKNAQEELDNINFADEKREALVNEYEKLKGQAIEYARELSAKRKACATSFEAQVKSELSFLNMPGISFIADISRVPLYSLGCDKVQFLISVNRGETPRPMSKIASGGELSRIMLAIKAVLSKHDKIDTLIFDEVDTGISGEAAKKVGERLKAVSKNRQTICITHLPQIAAMADHQMLISKRSDGEKTFTSVKPLAEEERVHELARMISGDNLGEIELDMARNLLKKRKSSS